MSELYTGQRRFITKPPEVRTADGKNTLTGTAIVYDSPSELLYGYFREYVLPGAFDDQLREKPDIMCFRDHRPDRILGRISAGTLRIIQTDKGIDVECDQPRTSYGIDLAESIQRGDIKGMSFGFDVVDDEWFTKDGERCRNVKRGKLYEVSFVTMPAYPATTADVRSIVDSRMNPNAVYWQRLLNRMR